MKTYQKTYQVEHMVGNMWGVLSEDDEGRYAFSLMSKESAEYAAMLLNNGVEAEDVEDAITRTECVRCGTEVFASERDESGRCLSCQP